MSRVAIAMAVYNDARYLGHALEALCAQTHRDFHLTLLDDASTDGSAALAEGFRARLELNLIRGEHRGRHWAKRAVADAVPADAPYLLVLDSDVALPPDALARMSALLDADPRLAVVCAHARTPEDRPFGRAQAFLDDLRHRQITDEAGHTRAIVGGCAMFRRSVLEGIDIRADIGEDNDLSEKLRGDWTLLTPHDLVATHYGVPTTLGGVWRRFHREGIRVRSFLRIYPEANQLGTRARLAPLPIAVIGLAGLATAQPTVVMVSAALGAAYVAAFLLASARVPGRMTARGTAALLFAFGNLGFGVGYLVETLRGAPTVMRDRSRSF